MATSISAQPTPMRALELLIEGNQRFTKSLRSLETFATRLGLEKLAKEGQRPFCMVLTCSDARIPTETIFDRGFGELFVVRVFGAVTDPAVIASLEYGAEHLNIPLLVVMGHTGCGAIRITHEVSELNQTNGVSENMFELTRKIAPVLTKTRKRLIEKNGSAEWEKIFAESQIENVRHSLKEILQVSALLRKRIANEQLLVLGGLYELDTGRMGFDISQAEEANT